jgi:hypothetical protein
MDDVRGTKKLYADLHFVNMPYVKKVTVPQEENAVWVYNYVRDVFLGNKPGNAHLAGRDAKYAAVHPAITKAEALAMLMHLAGDLHQPLHGTNHPYTDAKGKLQPEDRGGNSVDIIDAPMAGTAHGPGPMNLHHFWDGAYRESFANNQVKEGSEWSRPSTADSTVFGKKVHDLLDSSAPVVLGQSNALGWITESHRWGMQYGYEALGSDLGREKVTLSADYVNTANAKARQRLVRAGIRLAKELKVLLAH